MDGESDALTRKDIILIAINSFVAVVAATVAAVIAGEGRFAAANLTPGQVVGLVPSLVVLLITVIVLVAKWRSVLKLMRTLRRSAGTACDWVKRWTKANLQPLIGLIALLGVVYGAYTLASSPYVIALALGFAVALILLTRSLQATFRSPKRPRFEVVPLSVGGVTNANLMARYLDPPQGEVVLGGVEFLVGSAISDSENVRFIEADGHTETKLKLPKPAHRVKSVHLLINASGGWRIHRESSTVLEWTQIGKTRLNFGDGSSQDTELVLGDNIREWAIGNSPGNLVGRVADPLCRVVWKGKAISGKFAVIDKLEIPIRDSNRKKQLESIVFIRDIPHGAKASEGGLLHFLISAVTLEFGEQRRKL